MRCLLKRYCRFHIMKKNEMLKEFNCIAVKIAAHTVILKERSD